MARLGFKQDKATEALQQENERLKKSVAELSILNELATIINSTMALESIMDKVVAESVKALGTEQGAIHLLDKTERDNARDTEMRDAFKTLIRKADVTSPMNKYRLDVELRGWMLKYKQPLLINDFANNDILKGQPPQDVKILSLLSVPLLCKGNIIGVLTLFNKKEGKQFSEEDKRLLAIIASQSSQVIENARLYEEEKQLRLFEKEIETARAIQHRLLPKESPAISGFEVAGVSYAAKEVGGDYFDFIELRGGRWGIALGDVSGKGIPAALLMSHLQATVRNQAMAADSIVECISNANDFLYHNTESNKFATLFFGALDPSKREFTFVNAGHNFPMWLRADGSLSMLEKGGIVLGLMPSAPFEQDSLTLAKGECIVIFSDGVTEAENNFEEQFGEDRLENLITRNVDRSASELIDIIIKEVRAFEVKDQQDDDITLVVLKAA